MKVAQPVPSARLTRGDEIDRALTFGSARARRPKAMNRVLEVPANGTLHFVVSRVAAVADEAMGR